MATLLAKKLMFIRHAEKPPEEPPFGPPFGIDENGNQDKESLTERGWQRAKLLPQLFAPTSGDFRKGLAEPTAIYASAIGHIDTDQGRVGNKSKRPQQTVSFLAANLDLAVNITYYKDQESDLAEEIISKDGVILVCWEHDSIPKIVLGLPKSAQSITPFPTGWPQGEQGAVFDIVWVFDLAPDGLGYVFSSVQQALLDGDSPAN